ncbi:MAG: branched-chain amino acid transaminase [Terriglobales bacterium]
MALSASEKIWRNGSMVAWDDARIHVLSHVVSYGSAVFEGLRCYATPHGPAIFRLRDHMQRLLHSAKVYRMDCGYTRDQLESACLDIIRVNHLPQAYIRPIVLRGYGTMGIGVRPGDNPIETYIAAWNWAEYLGGTTITEGVDTCISSWTRMAPNTLPAMAKAAANYMNSQLIKQQALTDGYQEGIALDEHGFLSEGPGENLFLVRGGKLYTPPVSASILPGITRDAVLRLATDMGLEVLEQAQPREALYLAEEAFFCGTAVEISPIKSVDRLPVGSGTRGPITRAIQDRFFAIVKGEAEDIYGWLTPVSTPVGAR